MALAAAPATAGPESINQEGHKHVPLATLLRAQPLQPIEEVAAACVICTRVVYLAQGAQECMQKCSAVDGLATATTVAEHRVAQS